MEPEDFCALCTSFSDNYFQLEDSLRPPEEVYFEGVAELQAVLEKIINQIAKDPDSASHKICQQCYEEFRRIYIFMYQCVRSERKLRTPKQASNRLKRLKIHHTEFKTENDNQILQRNSVDQSDIAVIEHCTMAIKGDQDFQYFTIKEERDNCIEDIPTDITHETADLSILENIQSAEFVQGEHIIISPAIDSVIQTDDENHVKIEPISITYDSPDVEWIIQEAEFEPVKHSLPSTPHFVVENKLKCENCQQEFPFADLRHFNDHQKRCNPGHIFQCKTCKIKIKGRDSLIQHKCNIPEDRFKCDQCEAKFKSKDNLNTHKQTHTDLFFKRCNQCDAMFLSDYYLEKHIMTHANSIINCDECGLSMKNFRKLVEHKRKHSPQIFNCNYCQTKWKSWSQLQQHQRTHVEIETMTVGDGNRNETPHAQIAGNAGIIRIPAGRPLSCDQCPNRFRHKQSLEKHMEMHRNGEI